MTTQTDIALPSDYQSYIALSRYAKWRDDLGGRRESWLETVKRYFDFFDKHLERNFSKDALEVFRSARSALETEVLSLGSMPSMRALMTAGEALERDHVAGYNCAFTAIEAQGEVVELSHPKLDDVLTVNISNPRDFDEALYILMCGTGVGFSVERQFVNNLPKVGKKLNRRTYLPNNKNYPGVPKEELSVYDKKTNAIVVHDSKYGWASSYRILLTELYNGNFDIEWDVSKIRPAGARLKTFGGRASGPDPLVDLFQFTKEVMKNAEGRKLTSIECHDLMCKIAEIVVVGGVRRAALISLSNLTDERMRGAKGGQWWVDNPQRALSNNSVCYTEKPDVGIFLREMEELHNSRSGERGIFNRESAQKTVAKNNRRDPNHDFGCNPCSEILLRSKEFCNLTEVVVRPEDTLMSLKHKIECATIMGTLQSTLTDFIYLNPKWKENCDEERLLGVSLTGIMDHPILNGSPTMCSDMIKFMGRTDDGMTPLDEVLEELKNHAIKVNEEWANKLGIRPSAAITCVKPSGTVSQLVDSASGIHPRYSAFYVRTVRADKKDPLSKLMIEEGVPHEEDVMNSNVWVFSFPMKSPEKAVTRDEISALDQLELWLIYQRHWCEHKPSVTVYYRDEEFLPVFSWVYDHFDEVSGISFLPHSNHSYKQAPYQEITEEEYNRLVALMPSDVDFSKLPLFEKEDTTTSAKEYACTGDKCELT